MYVAGFGASGTCETCKCSWTPLGLPSTRRNRAPGPSKCTWKCNWTPFASPSAAWIRLQARLDPPRETCKCSWTPLGRSSTRRNCAPGSSKCPCKCNWTPLGLPSNSRNCAPGPSKCTCKWNWTPFRSSKCKDSKCMALQVHLQVQLDSLWAFHVQLLVLQVYLQTHLDSPWTAS